MSDNLHQSLSAVMDAADDDLELPRLLGAMATSPEQEKALGEKWQRYHLAQSILQGDLRGQDSLRLARSDLSERIMQELEAETNLSTAKEPALNQAAAKPVSDRQQWFRGGALAASVALLVITGVQLFNAGKDVVQPASAPSMATQQTSPQQQQPRSPAFSPAGIERVSSPFEPHAFTGRSLVNFAAGEQPASSPTAQADSFSIIQNPTPAAAPAR